MRLKRVAFGPLSLGRLAEGRLRPLTAAELKAIRELTGHRAPSRKVRLPRAQGVPFPTRRPGNNGGDIEATGL